MTDHITRFEIAKLELRDGDHLVVKVDELLSTDQIAWIKEHFEPYVPDGSEVIVLGRGMSLETLSRS